MPRKKPPPPAPHIFKKKSLFFKAFSTKDKILKTAHKLFAEKGLAGVSVRELANECDVNIAAINYHFTNKENLYLETLMLCMINMERDVSSLYEKHQSGSVDARSPNHNPLVVSCPCFRTNNAVCFVLNVINNLTPIEQISVFRPLPAHGFQIISFNLRG